MVVLTLWAACLACSTILLSLWIDTALAYNIVHKQPVVDIYHQVQQARALNYTLTNADLQFPYPLIGVKGERLSLIPNTDEPT